VPSRELQDRDHGNPMVTAVTSW